MQQAWVGQGPVHVCACVCMCVYVHTNVCVMAACVQKVICARELSSLFTACQTVILHTFCIQYVYTEAEISPVLKSCTLCLLSVV